ncbi:MAG: YihY/virulence factor BrkB family protein [Halobacteriales archaeon]
MGDYLMRAGTFLRAIVHEIRTDRITFMAGAIAYNAFLSLLPLLFVLLTIASTIGRGELQETLISLTEALVTAGAAEIFVAELRNASTGASLVGLVALAWGMFRIFRSLDTAFSDIYETQAENTVTDQIVDGIVVFGSLAALLIAVFTLESSFGFGDVTGFLSPFSRLFFVCVIGLTLTPLYYVFPDESEMGILETVPGVLFAAVALIVLQSIFGYYVALSDPAANNQLLASIVVLLTWLYFCGLVVLVGAAINATLSNRSEDVSVEPLVGGVPKEHVTEPIPDQTGVPRTTLERLQDALDSERQLRIVLEGDVEDFELPPPDTVTVNSDRSSIPVVNDTTSIELEWTETEVELESPG